MFLIKIFLFCLPLVPEVLFQQTQTRFNQFGQLWQSQLLERFRTLWDFPEEKQQISAGPSQSSNHSQANQHGLHHVEEACWNGAGSREDLFLVSISYRYYLIDIIYITLWSLAIFLSEINYLFFDHLSFKPNLWTNQPTVSSSNLTNEPLAISHPASQKEQ